MSVAIRYRLADKITKVSLRNILRIISASDSFESMGKTKRHRWNRLVKPIKHCYSG